MKVDNVALRQQLADCKHELRQYRALVKDLNDYDEDLNGCPECLCGAGDHEDYCPWHWIRSFKER